MEGAAVTKRPVVYILASQRNGTLYVGVTSHLVARVFAHKNDLVPGFTRRYRVHTLVFYEFHGTMLEAIAREKRIKRWRRRWKLALIESKNPEWTDLYPELLGSTCVVSETLGPGSPPGQARGRLFGRPG